MNNTKQTLLIATGLYPPDIGGPATYSKLLAEELPKKGVNVKILSFGEVRHFPVGLRHLVYFLKCISRGRKCGYIYAQDTVSVGLPSLLAAKIMGKKFLIRVPGDYAWEQGRQRFGVMDSIDEFQNRTYHFKVEFLRCIQRFVVSEAQVVITPSNYFHTLVKGWSKKNLHIVTIYNGIDINIDINIQSEEIPYESKKKILMSAGRLVSWKGFETLISLVKELDGWELHIVGSGPERKQLEEYARTCDVEKRVIFTGVLDKKGVVKRLSESRIFLLNSSFESFSFQVVEALNAMVPVIATRIGSIPELIDDGKEGVLLFPNDKSSFLDAIMKIDRDRDFRDKIVQNGKSKSKKFSINETVTRFVDILQTI